jgi:hypothetical protein
LTGFLVFAVGAGGQVSEYRYFSAECHGFVAGQQGNFDLLHLRDGGRSALTFGNFEEAFGATGEVRFFRVFFPFRSGVGQIILVFGVQRFLLGDIQLRGLLIERTNLLLKLRDIAGFKTHCRLLLWLSPLQVRRIRRRVRRQAL